jgi:S1-C subfamily serine protease
LLSATLLQISDRSGRARVVALALVVGLMLLLPGSARAAAYCGAGESPQFRFGFAHLKSLLGPTMGEPIECEHANPDNGDTLQQTSTGLSFYRKATNTPTFTDGWNHWAWTIDGLVTWTGSDIDPPGTVLPAEPEPEGPTTTIAADAPVLTAARLVANHRAAVVRIDTADGCGSGSIINSAGYVMTNAHVVRGFNEAAVTLDDGRRLTGTVVASDSTNDVAVLKLPDGTYDYLRIRSSSEVPIGGEVAMLGFPVTLADTSTGLNCSTEVTITRGIISTRITYTGLSFLQTDATVNRGNSGGAALDLTGALIGIPTLGLDAATAENTSFLIPSDRFRPIVENWINGHRTGSLAPPTPPEPAARSAENPELSYSSALEECNVEGENAIAWIDFLQGFDTPEFQRWDNFIIIGTVERPVDTIVHLIYDYGDSQGYDTVAIGQGYDATYGPFDVAVRSMTFSGWWTVGVVDTGLVPNYTTRFDFVLIFDSGTLILMIDGEVAFGLEGLSDNIIEITLGCQNFSDTSEGRVRFHDLELWGWD